MVPGGALNADNLRANPRMPAFIQAMADAGKPMAVICHVPWELINAFLVRGRTLTSDHTFQDDVRDAGGNWADHEVGVEAIS
jgi:protease I